MVLFTATGIGNGSTFRTIAVIFDRQQAGPVLGCPDKGPFDAIIVSAASPVLPESLISQLAPGGRLIVPVGTLDQQDLVHVLRTDEGLALRMLGACRFVPLIGREAFPKPL